MTAAKFVYSTWKTTKPGARHGKAIYRHRSTPQPVHLLHPARNERTYVTEWELEDVRKFVKKLRPDDEIAVEITGNTRLFYDAVVSHVARVVVVNTTQFKKIRQSMKKTDPHDARALALYYRRTCCRRCA